MEHLCTTTLLRCFFISFRGFFMYSRHTHTFLCCHPHVDCFMVALNSPVDWILLDDTRWMSHIPQQSYSKSHKMGPLVLRRSNGTSLEPPGRIHSSRYLEISRGYEWVPTKMAVGLVGKLKETPMILMVKNQSGEDFPYNPMKDGIWIKVPDDPLSCN